MTELQMIQNQSDQIDRLISLNNWTVGIFITIIIAVIGFLGILQWRLSDKQIQSIKIDLEKSISEKYKLESVKLLEDRMDKQQRMLDKLIQDVITSVYIASIPPITPETVDEIQLNMIIHSLSILNIYENLAPDDLVLKHINSMLAIFSGPSNRIKEADIDYLDLLVGLIDRKASENIKTKEAYIKLKDLSAKKVAIL